MGTLSRYLICECGTLGLRASPPASSACEHQPTRSTGATVRDSPERLFCGHSIPIRAASAIPILLVAAIIGFEWYTYVWLFLVRNIRGDLPYLDNGAAIAELLLFHVFFCMTVWSYVKVVATRAGVRARGRGVIVPAALLTRVLPSRSYLSRTTRPSIAGP